MESELGGGMSNNMNDLSYEQLKTLYDIQATQERKSLRIELVKALAPVMYNKNDTEENNAINIIKQVDTILYHLNILK